MKKILHLFGIVLLFFLAGSCSENNPAYIFGWDDPEDISGPRMLKNVIMNNQTEEAYFPNAGNLHRVERKIFNGNTAAGSQTVYLSFLGTKLSKVEVNGSIPGNTSSGKSVLTPNYNESGKLVSLMNDYYEGSIHKKHSVTVYNYNEAGKIIHAYQKTADVNPATPNIYVYPNVVIDAITYEGNNVTKVISSKQVINLQSGTIESDVKTTYEYSNFDWRKNPYTTIVDHYLVAMGSLYPEMYVQLSDNNAGKMKIKTGSEPATETIFNNIYDTHNYLKSNGFKAYKYQPAP